MKTAARRCHSAETAAMAKRIGARRYGTRLRQTLPMNATAELTPLDALSAPAVMEFQAETSAGMAVSVTHLNPAMIALAVLSTATMTIFSAGTMAYRNTAANTRT